MMSITKIIALVACLLWFSVFTHGAKDGLLRKKSFTNNDAIRVKNINKLPSDSDIQSAFRELLDTSIQLKLDSSMSLSMSMSYSGRPLSTVPPSIVASIVSPVVVGPPVPLVTAVVTNKSTEEKQQKVASGALTGGAIIGIAVAAVGVVVVGAILVKKRNT